MSSLPRCNRHYSTYLSTHNASCIFLRSVDNNEITEVIMKLNRKSSDDDDDITAVTIRMSYPVF